MSGPPDERRRILIIANPAAGRSRSAKRRLDRIVDALERRGCSVELRRAGPRTGEVERLAREAEAAFDIVVAAGGDGTINAVANGLNGAPRPIAILPFGTANVLAYDIGLPRQSAALADLIVGGTARPIWPGRVAERLFLTMASSGFDADTVRTVDPRMKRRFGRLAFAWAILVCLFRYRERPLTVTIDGTEFHAATVIASKGRCYAGPYVIVPDADQADSFLHVVLFNRHGRLAVLRYLTALITGRFARRSDVTVLRASTVCVSAGEPIPVQADGEPAGYSPAIFTVADKPLYLVQP